MTKAIAKLVSISPIVFSKHYSVPAKPKESPKDYEVRTWRERSHYDINRDNQLYIPGLMFKNALSSTAKYLSMQIQGKGKSTYTKHFEAGIMNFGSAIYLDAYRDTVAGLPLFVPSDGIRGSSKRVDKTFPIVHHWSGEIELVVIDSTITEEVFLKHLKEAGALNGIGAFRPRQNGEYGRFAVESLQWIVEDED